MVLCVNVVCNNYKFGEMSIVYYVLQLHCCELWRLEC